MKPWWTCFLSGVGTVLIGFVVVLSVAAWYLTELVDDIDETARRFSGIE